MNVFIARQPIFNRHQKVYGYELLYRSGLENRFDDCDGDRATTQVITNSLQVFGLNSLTGDKKAFINFTKNLIQAEAVTHLPADRVIVEILENITLDSEFLKACHKLKNLGYILALDDFVFAPKYEPLIQLADIIKIDFLNSPPEYRLSILQSIKAPHIKFLAEKIETVTDYKEAMDLGYSYFQGYFFCKPEIIAGKDLPAYKLTYLRLLQQVHQPDLDFNKLEQIIQQDVTLSYKLFKYINSAIFGFASKINTIKNALVILGVREVKKWISLIALKGMGEDKPVELVIDSVMRAHFCEMLAPLFDMRNRSYDLFLMGMFSTIDTFMDRPMDEILTELPIAYEIKEALLGKRNALYDVFNLCQSYKEGNWEEVDYYINKFHIAGNLLQDLYNESLRWVDQVLLLN